MNTPRQFQLIDGTFTPSEASRVLLSLVNSKMDYHRLEQLSNHERFGQDTSHSEVRLRDLAKLHANLKEYLSQAADSNQSLRITGRIEIEVIRDPVFEACLD